MKSAEILIIEDDKDIRTSLCELLVEEGYEVTTAVNGSEGMKYLENHQSSPPQLILLDLMMPVMDGETFLRTFKENFPDINVPVVVFSASLHFKSNDLVVGFIKKPLDLENLMNVVDTYVKRKDSLSVHLP